MSSAFSIALSGLQAESLAIDTTGNNLANMNTDGFKESDVDFKDLFSEQLGSFQSGLGVAPPVSNQIFAQGAIQTSSSPLAAALQGSGFFVVTSPTGGQEYTRDGNFVLDSSGVLQTQTGENVQGWTATSSGIDTTGATGDIVVSSSAILPPTATSNFSLNANLDASATAGTTAGTFSTPMQVVDSLGNTHTLTVAFAKSSTAANTWGYTVSIPSADLTSGGSGTLATGNIAFNSAGAMTSANASSVPLSITGLADGASDMSISWNLFDSSGNGELTQYAETSSLASSTQNGSQASQLTSVNIQNGGQVVATFSNGQTKVEAQLALAAIQNPSSLQSVGNNNFAVSSTTATPAVGVPQTGGRGQILGGSLESSNVDMATQLTNLIVYQSAYQANSRVITTADQMNQDLFQLIH